jgi:glutathione S-transferase
MMAGVIVESTLIFEYVDDQWPDQPLKPKDSFGRAQTRLSTKQLDVGLQPVPTIRRRADAARTVHLIC